MRYIRYSPPTMYPEGPRPVKNEAWVEQALPGGWSAFLRVINQGGRPVVAEVRVVPKTPEAKPGGWSESAEDVPRGGLTQRGQLRRVRLEEALQLAVRDATRAVERGYSIAHFGAREDWAMRTRQGGGRRLTDEGLARLVQGYLDLVGAHEPMPVVELARRRGMTTAAVRERLRKAKARDLFEPLAPGRAGGELTAKGLALLDKEESER